jgi:hypothetical protein
MRHFVRAAPQHSLGSLARLLWLDLHRLLGDYEMGRLVVKHAFAAIGALSVSVFLAALAAGVGLLHASLLGVFALAFMCQMGRHELMRRRFGGHSFGQCRHCLKTTPGWQYGPSLSPPPKASSGIAASVRTRCLVLIGSGRSR